MKKIPIGVDDFKEIISNDFYYVDKTKYIEDILKDKSKIYWEHLGMIGVESYDKHWKEKLDIYRKYFPNQYVFTYENTEISNSVLDKLKELNLI